MNATMGRSYSRDGGSMTLYIELYDSETDDLLAKAMDKRVNRNNHYMHLQSRPAIRSEVRRMMKPWAEALRKGLDRARQETGEDKDWMALPISSQAHGKWSVAFGDTQ